MVEGDTPVIIIGGGLAGLQCARTLHQQGRSFVLLERDKQLGGRVATSSVDGFRCDRGFQVLPSGDPDVRRFLPMDRLRPGRFMSGAMVRRGDRWCHLADPRRHPRYLVEQCFGLGGIKEKLNFARWIGAMMLRGPGQLPAGHDISEEIQRCNLDGELTELFIKPWLQGITLDLQLTADAAAVKAYVAGFLRGPAVLPACGMAAIPAALADDLPADSIKLGHAVRSVTSQQVIMDDGSKLSASGVIIAADGPNQQALLQHLADGSSGIIGFADSAGNEESWQSVRAYHFALPSSPPINKPWLVLPGDCPGPIASVSFPSLVAEDYAPAGRHLATVAVLEADSSHSQEDSHCLAEVRAQLQRLFGQAADTWECIHQDHITTALPPQRPQDLSPKLYAEHQGIILCGDCHSRPGIGAALASGDAAAQAMIKGIE